MNPKLSIIIPIYNTEKYLSKCLDSVINQSFKDFEIICIDNASTDNSLEILLEYAQEDKRIKVISKQVTGNVATSRNLGLKNAKGEFVTFIDSDDWIEPNTYDLTLSKLTDDVDLVCFEANIVVDKESNFDEENAANIEGDKIYHRIKFEGKLQINNYVFMNTTVKIWNKIFKNSIIKNYNISFNENLSYADDANFTHKYLLMSKNAYFVAEYLYNYLRRDDSTFVEAIQNKKLVNVAEGVLSCYDLYEFLKEKNLLKQKLSIFLEILYAQFYFNYVISDKTTSEVFFKNVYNIISKMDFGFNFSDPLIESIKNKDYSKCLQVVKKIYQYEY